jgi:hypothetical protein
MKIPAPVRHFGPEVGLLADRQAKILGDKPKAGFGLEAPRDL